MSKHTPGPFHADPSATGAPEWLVRAADGTTLALCMGPDAEHNARLFAAAPECKQQRDELLEALEDLLDEAIEHRSRCPANPAICDGDCTCGVTAKVLRAAAALRKARKE